MEPANFKRRFLLFILLTWNLPPLIGFGFIMLFGVLTTQQIIEIITMPVEPVYILGWQIFIIWFFPKKLRPLTDWLKNRDTADSSSVLSAVRQFPLWYWGLFLLYQSLAVISVVAAAALHTDFVITPLILFRFASVALIVSIIVGLPIFFLIMDLFGKAMGGLVVKRPIVTIRTKVFLIGALTPLLIDTMLVQYYWTRTGYFTTETFIVWLLLELLAVGGSLIFMRSFGQSLGPLQTVLKHTEDLSTMDFSLIQSKSTDELGVLSGSYRRLLNMQRHSNMESSKSKAEFEAVFNSISDGVIYSDTQGKIILVNPAITEMFGYSAQELKDNVTTRLYADPKDYEDQEKQRFRSEAEDNHALYEMQYRRKDQSYFFGKTYYTRVTGNDGKVIGLLEIIRDITQKKQTEETLRQFQQRLGLHFMQTPLGVIEWDLDFNVVDWNPAIENIFGYSKQAAIGRHGSFIIPNAAKEHVNSVWNDLIKNTGGLNSTNENITKSGVIIHCRWHNTPLVDGTGKVIGVTSLVEDITETLKVEEELKKHQEKLEELVDDRTAKLKTVIKELEAFAYSVSHDLRAPLRAIDGFSLALLEDYGEKLDDEGQDYLHRVRNGAGRMALLIDDLLQLSRISRGKLRRETVNISKLARDIVNNLNEQESERKVQFDITTGMRANGDQHLLVILMENLLTNAWKYTRKKTTARVTVGKIVQAGKTIFYVKDNGAGFDMQYAGKLFGAFQRLHSDEDFEGTGIGLATVQRIVHRHGGNVWAEAEVDQGATFYFSLGSAMAFTGKKSPVIDERKKITTN
ncbi:MAG: PAS domain S-box protein [Acidiferrobacterales bacterium]